jgi:hypothetical protein
MNTTLLDTHLHLYPNYDLPLAFNQLLDRSASQGTRVNRVACLAERHDCHFHQQLSDGSSRLSGFEVTPGIGNAITIKRESDGLQLSLLPGRQVITRENIEVLALACPEMIDDGQPALDVIYQINQLQRVPVLTWSPGKWFGERGKLVERLINELDKQDFLIGDTTLRPYGWSTPRLMKMAQDKGFTVIAGSDPLPFSGEEHWLGAYYTVAESEQAYDAEALLHAIKNHQAGLQCHNQGQRTQIFSLFDRLRKNAASKKS